MSHQFDMPIHVITETREDFVDRQNRNIVFALKFMWYIFLSQFLILPTLTTITNDSSLSQTVAIIFLFGCAYAEFVSKGKVKSIVKTILGGIYLVLGANALYLVTTQKTSNDMLTAGILTIALFYAGYKNIDKYTNLIPFIMSKIKS